MKEIKVIVEQIYNSKHNSVFKLDNEITCSKNQYNSAQVKLEQKITKFGKEVAPIELELVNAKEVLKNKQEELEQLDAEYPLPLDKLILCLKCIEDSKAGANQTKKITEVLPSVTQSLTSKIQPLKVMGIMEISAHHVSNADLQKMANVEFKKFGKDPFLKQLQAQNEDPDDPDDPYKKYHLWMEKDWKIVGIGKYLTSYNSDTI